MNRLLVASLLTLSITAFGCAAGTDDPDPTPSVDEPQRDPPKQVRVGEFDDPYDSVVVGVDDYRLPPEVAPRQTPPIPGR